MHGVPNQQVQLITRIGSNNVAASPFSNVRSKEINCATVLHWVNDISFSGWNSEATMRLRCRSPIYHPAI